MKDTNVRAIQNPEAVIENPQGQIMPLASDEKCIVVIACLFKDFPANRTGALDKIEGLELRLPKLFPVPGMTPFPHPEVPCVGITHLERQHMNVRSLLELRNHFAQFELGSEM